MRRIYASCLAVVMIAGWEVRVSFDSDYSGGDGASTLFFFAGEWSVFLARGARILLMASHIAFYGEMLVADRAQAVLLTRP